MNNNKDLPKREAPVKPIKNVKKQKTIKLAEIALFFVSILFIVIGIGWLKMSNTENAPAYQESINETLYVDAGNEDVNKNHTETPNEDLNSNLNDNSNENIIENIDSSPEKTPENTPYENQNQPTENVKEDVSEKIPEETTEHTNMDSYTDIEEKPSLEDTPLNQALKGALSFDHIVHDHLPEPCNKFYYFVVEKGDNISFVFESKFQSVDSDKTYWDIEFFSVDSSLDITDDYHFQTESEGNVIEVELNTLNFTPGIYMLKIGSAERHTSDEYSFQLINECDTADNMTDYSYTIQENNEINIVPLDERIYDCLTRGYYNYYDFVLEKETSLIFNFECEAQGVGIKETYWNIEIYSDTFYHQICLEGDVAGCNTMPLQLQPGSYCIKVGPAEKYSDGIYSFILIT